MENPSQDQSNNLPSTQDKVPHGGERPDFELGPLNTGEVPRLVKELDARETVPDALVGRTKIEDTVDALATSDICEASIDTQPKRERLGLGAKIGAAVAGLAIVAGSAFGISKALDSGNESNLPPESEPVATAPSGTGPSSAEVEPNNSSFDIFEIPATTPEDKVGTVVANNIDSWLMYGSEDPNFNNNVLLAIANGEVENDDEYGREFAHEVGPKIANKLFVKGWENDPELSKWVNLFESNHAVYITLRGKTTDSGNSNDVEPFSYSTAVDSTTTEETSGGLKVTIEAEEEVNIDKNRASELSPSIANINGHEFTMTTLLVKEGGKYKISSLNIESR